MEGTQSSLGKPSEMDGKKYFDFVTVPRQEEARKVMRDHYCMAIEILKEVPLNTSFLKHLLFYMINRKH
ncbi:hypothetical protein RZN22_16940 [Bacillaceae bacterium S4-13-58]